MSIKTSLLLTRNMKLYMFIYNTFIPSHTDKKVRDAGR